MIAAAYAFVAVLVACLIDIGNLTAPEADRMPPAGMAAFAVLWPLFGALLVFGYAAIYAKHYLPHWWRLLRGDQ